MRTSNLLREVILRRTASEPKRLWSAFFHGNARYQPNCELDPARSSWKEGRGHVADDLARASLHHCGPRKAVHETLTSSHHDGVGRFGFAGRLHVVRRHRAL